MSLAHRVALALALALAAILRLAAPAWDGLLAAHPDERNILLVASDLRGLDPYRTGEPGVWRSFAYGHVPLYLLAGVGVPLGAAPDPYTQLLLLGRVAAGLADTLTVLVVYALARQVAGSREALLAAAAYAVAPLPVQLAHFYTTDPLLTLFVSGALLFATRYVTRGHGSELAAAAVLAGLAIGTKASAALLVLPVLVAALWRIGAAQGGSTRSGPRGVRWRPHLAAAVKASMPACAIIVATFILTNPFALWHVDLFAGSLLAESSMVTGAADVPYTRQFAGTWPYAYQADQLARWALGPLLAALAAGGAAYATYRAARGRSTPAEVVLLAWALPYALVTGALYAKFARYLLPVVPLLCVYAAWLAAQLAARARLLAAALAAAALIWAGAHAAAVAWMDTQPHPWVSASQWIYTHVPRGASLGVERWDDALPAPLVLDGRPRDSGEYHFVTLDPFAPDTPAKLNDLSAAVASSDYLVLSSQRLYGVIPRLAEQGDARYRATACYYRRLFAGEVGFEFVHAETRFPRLGPLVWVDRAFRAAGLPEPAGLPVIQGLVVDLGRVDESYNVYDHPQVLIFANREHWDAGRIRAAVDGCR